MDLYIKDRIYIPQMLSQQNNFMEFNLKRSIVQKVAITEQDKETYHIKEDAQNGRVTWDAEIDQSTPLSVEFSKDELKYLTQSCEKLSDTPFPDDFWAVVEKIYSAAQVN